MSICILTALFFNYFLAIEEGVDNSQPTVLLDESYLTIRRGEHCVLKYKYNHVPKKPYVMSLFTPTGINILRDAPEDHLHHHGLMYAITVNDSNFWEESVSGGIQEHKSFNTMGIAKNHVQFTTHVVWFAPGSDMPLLDEERTLVYYNSDDDKVRLLSWYSKLSAANSDEPVVLSGKIYHGLGMRFPEFMDKRGTFLFADDVTGSFDEGPHHMAQASWCAYVLPHENTPVTIAMFSTSDNPRSTLWFTMLEPFSYLSATYDLARKPLTLRPAQSVIMHYGIAACDGTMDRQAIEALYAYWNKISSTLAIH